MIALGLLSAGTTFAGSDGEDFICTGKDRSGEKITVTWDGWADNRDSARVDLTVDVDGVGPRTTVDLGSFAPGGDFEGFDYATGNESLSLTLYVFARGEIRGDFYSDGKFNKKDKMTLKCYATNL